MIKKLTVGREADPNIYLRSWLDSCFIYNETSPCSNGCVIAGGTGLYPIDCTIINTSVLNDVHIGLSWSLNRYAN